MRLFLNLREAAKEIKRDLSKSPKVPTSSVQGVATEGVLREALDYSYSIAEMPKSRTEFLDVGRELGFWDYNGQFHVRDWLVAEEYARVGWKPGAITEALHPALKQVVDREPDYTYTDRLAGAKEALAADLVKDPGSRRAYWPIFWHDDVYRAPRAQRVPCSLAYQVLIREVGGVSKLHMTYMQRACDFDKFWITDLWLAHTFQDAVMQAINQHRLPSDLVHLGNLTHFVTSLHSFVKGEIY